MNALKKEVITIIDVVIKQALFHSDHLVEYTNYLTIMSTADTPLTAPEETDAPLDTSQSKKQKKKSQLRV